jgi:voltage-gated hydrogen channel 1
VDVLLRGVIEEVASLVVILRLWRVVKIIEELSVGAQEQMEDLIEKVTDLQWENEELKAELKALKATANK